MRVPTGASTKTTYVDRADLPEIFADALNLTFDGETLRLEFCIDRLDPACLPPAGSPELIRRPMARIVLPLSAATELMNKLNQTMGPQRAARAALATMPTDRKKN